MKTIKFFIIFLSSFLFLSCTYMEDDPTSTYSAYVRGEKLIFTGQATNGPVTLDNKLIGYRYEINCFTTPYLKIKVMDSTFSAKELFNSSEMEIVYAEWGNDNKLDYYYSCGSENDMFRIDKIEKDRICASFHFELATTDERQPRKTIIVKDGKLDIPLQYIKWMDVKPLE